MFRALLCPSSGARDYNVDYHVGLFVLGFFQPAACSLQPRHYSNLTAPNLQTTANQERNDQRGNQHYSRELLMMAIVVPKTCWAYKKHNKIKSGIYLGSYSSVITMMHGPANVKFRRALVCRPARSLLAIPATMCRFLISTRWHKKTGTFEKPNKNWRNPKKKKLLTERCWPFNWPMITKLLAQGPCSAVVPTVHGCHYAFQKFPFFCVTLYMFPNVRPQDLPPPRSKEFK